MGVASHRAYVDQQMPEHGIRAPASWHISCSVPGANCIVVVTAAAAVGRVSSCDRRYPQAYALML